MREQTTILELSESEYNVALRCLNDKRNQLIEQDRPTDAVDDTLITFVDKGKKKGRMRREER